MIHFEDDLPNEEEYETVVEAESIGESMEIAEQEAAFEVGWSADMADTHEIIGGK